MQEGCFPGVLIKNFCTSLLLLTMLPFPTSSWMLLQAHIFFPNDFRREDSETWTLLSLLFPNFLLAWAVSPLFAAFTLISDWLTVHPSSEVLHLLSVWCLREGHWGQSNTRRMSHVKSLKTPGNTLLAKWQIGGDMAKEQKIMDETEKVDWIPLFLHLCLQEKGIFSASQWWDWLIKKCTFPYKVWVDGRTPHGRELLKSRMWQDAKRHWT